MNRPGLAWLAALLLAPSARGEPLDDGGYVFENNEREASVMQAAREEIPRIEVELPAERLARLPKSMEKLRAGGTLRIVMLGDSIVNDTARSAWHELVEAAYPGSEIKRVVSVRGSTGCWFYKEPGKIERYVLSQTPDLVIIGGISQRGDAASIRECIEQIRAARECEFLLLTGPFGEADPFAGEDWRERVREGADAKYAEELRALAEECDAEFFDLQRAWGDYLRAGDKPLDFYKRDAVHANARGEAVLGRILAAYFAPR